MPIRAFSDQRFGIMGASIASIHEVRIYRPFIDGLRAIAILTVVGSHISRILPAFLLVMVVCLALSTTIFMQAEPKDFAESFFLSAIMFANHHFLSHTGYFDMAAVTKPLLHMWSLAVEEQFYLLAPLTLLAMTATTAKMKPENRRKTWIAVTFGLGIVSFVACVMFTYPSIRPNVSFYIMPTRGWEFILGGAVPAFATIVRRLPAIVNKCLAIAGAAAIVLAVVCFDADMLYPFYWAAVPVIGATLIITGGLVEPRNLVARALATRPMVWIGLVSYPWYLWHWPLISFVRTMNFGEQSFAEEIGAAALSLALAVLTYRFVELPVRRLRKNRKFRPAAVVALGTASCVLVASLGYLWSLRITPLMLPQLSGHRAASNFRPRLSTRFTSRRSEGRFACARHRAVVQGIRPAGRRQPNLGIRRWMPAVQSERQGWARKACRPVRFV